MAKEYYWGRVIGDIGEKKALFEKKNYHEEREEHEGKEGRMPEMSKQFEALSGQVIGCAIEVHRFSGSGLSGIVLSALSQQKIDLFHEAQIITYMKLAGIQIGLICNFTVTKLKDGMKRYVL